MDHVHHLFELVLEGEDKDYSFMGRDKKKDFGMLWSSRYIAMEAWSLAVSQNGSEVRMT